MKKHLLLLCLLWPACAMAAKNLSKHAPADSATFNLIIQNLEKKEIGEYSANISKILRLNYRADLQRDFADFIVVQVQNNKQLNAIAQDVNPSSTTLFNKSYTDYIKDKVTESFITKNNNASPEDKNFFKSILNNLTTSQSQSTSTFGSIFHAAMSLTPVSGFVDKVIGSVSSWIATSKVGIGNGIKSISAAVNQDQITAFQNSIKNHVDFYDLTLNASKDFDVSLKNNIDKSLQLQGKLNKNYALISTIFTKYNVTPLSDESAIKKAFPYKKTYLGEEYNEDFRSLLQYCTDADNLSVQLNGLKNDIVESGKNYLATIDAIEKKYKALIDPADNKIAQSQQKIQDYAVSKGATLIDANNDLFKGKIDESVKTTIQEIKTITIKSKLNFGKMQTLQ